MKKALFIDRDGTLIIEPEDEQIDSFEKLEYYPGVFTWLGKISRELDFELVMVTNQDGLGTNSFPEESFWPAHNRMLDTFRNEGIIFDEIIIDRTLPGDNQPTRKPGIALLSKYLSGTYNIKNSYVIGDRLTDIQLAKNLGCLGIFLNDGSKKDAIREQGIDHCCTMVTTSWREIYELLLERPREAMVKRATHETDISVYVNLDGKGKSNIHTGIGFFDHMLDQIARHGSLDLDINVKGDLEVDEHHTIEDTAIALGEAVARALGSKRGIERYGFCLPMDDALAQVALDFGGRNWIVWEATFNREKIGEMPTEMFYHFFKSFSDAAKCNLNIKVEGKNEHHKVEAIFKAFAKAIKMAVKKDKESNELPSTKGMI